MEYIQTLEIVITCLFALCYLYQFFYTFYVLFTKEVVVTPTEKRRKFTILVAARNEENVLPHLIDSLHKQNYPSELIKIVIIADNCTDNTAGVARNMGCVVYERFDTELIGKGYALNYAFKDILDSDDDTDAFVVFDADNLVDCEFIAEMNKIYDEDCVGFTCYRNSKNYGTNWISAGYSQWFLREAKYLNSARMRLKTSCAISGTGFCLKKSLVEENGGWPFHLLTEDIEFTMDVVTKGERIGYCPTAVIYDEQPITFGQSWTQRLRWSKGFYQVFMKYGAKLFKKMPKSFACYDMLMTVTPAVALTLTNIIFNIIKIVYGLIYFDTNSILIYSGLKSMLFFLGGAFFMLFFVGTITVITEWDQIKGCSGTKKILYCFTFPLFMLTYIPIAVTALFKRIDWVPVKHVVEGKIEDMD